MSSARDNRQRAAARARLEREMAARREAARRKRLLQARIGGGVAAAVMLAAIVWIIVAATGGGGGSENAANGGPKVCNWVDDAGAYVEVSPAASASPSPGAASATPGPSVTPRAGIKDVGKPPNPVPNSGFQVITFSTNLGVVKVEMDLSKTPCTAASLAYLASKKFYDGSFCHRMVSSIFALQCGDPSGTGSGGATYRVPDENLPTGKLPAYHEGDVAMANTGQPDTNGSQFFFLWANSSLPGNYSLFGRVIAGMDIVKKVAAGGDDGAFEGEGQAGGGHPKIKITLKSVSVGPVTPTSQASPSPSASASPSPAGSPAPSAT